MPSSERKTPLVQVKLGQDLVFIWLELEAQSHSITFFEGWGKNNLLLSREADCPKSLQELTAGTEKALQNKDKTLPSETELFKSKVLHRRSTIWWTRQVERVSGGEGWRLCFFLETEYFLAPAVSFGRDSVPLCPLFSHNHCIQTEQTRLTPLKFDRNVHISSLQSHCHVNISWVLSACSPDNFLQTQNATDWGYKKWRIVIAQKVGWFSFTKSQEH